MIFAIKELINFRSKSCMITFLFELIFKRNKILFRKSKNLYDTYA